jgi:hypothetical protein
MVKGARVEMITVTVSPIITGAMELGGPPTLHPSVNKKMVVTSKKVPTASAIKAKG